MKPQNESVKWSCPECGRPTIARDVICPKCEAKQEALWAESVALLTTAEAGVEERDASFDA